MPIALRNDGTPRVGWLTGKCAFCRVKFPYRVSNATGTYCSNSCFHEEQWKQRKTEIRKTKMFVSSVEAKRYLIEKLGHRCSICKNTFWMDEPIPLVLDHKDGDADNWQVSNLRHLCANCDRQQPTFGSRNRGKGRKARLAKLHEHNLSLAKTQLKVARLLVKTKKLEYNLT